MKGLFLATVCVAGFSGCSIQDIEDHYSMEKADDNFKKLCHRDKSLLICGSLSKDILEKDFIPEVDWELDSNVEYFGISEAYEFYAYGFNELNPSNYLYTEDSDGEYYQYMYSDVNGIRRGDCEDYVITFIEDNIENGNLIKGKTKAEWIFGRVNGDHHAWVILTKDGKQYLFDTDYRYGVSFEKAYSEQNYEKVGIVYSY